MNNIVGLIVLSVCIWYWEIMFAVCYSQFGFNFSIHMLFYILPLFMVVISIVGWREYYYKLKEKYPNKSKILRDLIIGVCR